jgi:hypothetical protein
MGCLRVVAVVALFWGGLARAEEDPSALYEVSTTGSTGQLKAGQKGKWVLSIQAKAGAHVSDDAPMKIELSGTHVKVGKEKLARPDAIAQGASPRFEVPFSADAPGKGSIDAKLTFFICTDKICSRQQKAVSVPVEVL